MSAASVRAAQQSDWQEQLRVGREILRAEAQAVLEIADSLSDPFCRAVDLLHRCQSAVIVSGIGKAGLIGQKVAATLASTGTRSHFLHPAEALHGDLGRVRTGDVVLMLSFSGQTDEVVRLIAPLTEM